MSLIPFPDVPNLPGVPSIPRLPSIGSIASSISPNTNLTTVQPNDSTPQTYSQQSTPQWQITDTSGTVLVTPDSVIDFEYRGETKIANYPVEKGSFASYNKVYTPFDARVTISCNGKGAMTRDKFLTTISGLKDGLQLCAIVTPDAVYSPCNLVHVDYRREARQGMSLLMAQLWFQEVREVATATVNAAKPDGADASKNGQLSPVKPKQYDLGVTVRAGSL